MSDLNTIPPTAVPQAVPATKAMPNGLKDSTLTWAGTTYEIAAFGGVRWDHDRREIFFVDRSGKHSGTSVVGGVADYRAIEALCLPWWRAHKQSIGE